MYSKSSSYILPAFILIMAVILSGCPVKRKMGPPPLEKQGGTGALEPSAGMKDLETVEVVDSEGIPSADLLSPEDKGTIDSEDIALSEEELAASASNVVALESFDASDILFEYDNADLNQQNRDTLAKIADWMSRHTTARLRIEGHADERGTSEYNLALGERRASAARKYLVALGLDADRFSTVSYGEEMPLDYGHTEAAWSRNRRVHFELKGM